MHNSMFIVGRAVVHARGPNGMRYSSSGREGERQIMLILNWRLSCHLQLYMLTITVGLLIMWYHDMKCHGILISVVGYDRNTILIVPTCHTYSTLVHVVTAVCILDVCAAFCYRHRRLEPSLSAHSVVIEHVAVICQFSVSQWLQHSQWYD